MDEFLNGTWIPLDGGRFKNRYDAGRGIAHKFKDMFSRFEGSGVVVGLIRGGIEVAAAISDDLRLPLDFRAVRKIGHPLQPEFAIGAVDISGIIVKNPFLGPGEMPSTSDFDRMAQNALNAAKELEQELRGQSISKIPGADWCLVVDDGAATGLTILAAVQGLKSEGKKVYAAVPVSSDQAAFMLRQDSDGFCALEIPEYFGAVGQFYNDFTQVETEDAKRWLRNR